MMTAKRQRATLEARCCRDFGRLSIHPARSSSGSRSLGASTNTKRVQKFTTGSHGAGDALSSSGFHWPGHSLPKSTP